MDGDDQSARIAAIRALAVHVWSSEEDADAWMHRPHSLLDGKPPMEVARTEDGAQRATKMLQRLYNGLPV